MTLQEVGQRGLLELDADLLAESRSRGRPRNRISPEVGSVTPSIISTVVVLPAPLGPSSPKQVASAISNEMPSTARTPG